MWSRVMAFMRHGQRQKFRFEIEANTDGRVILTTPGGRIVMTPDEARDFSRSLAELADVAAAYLAKSGN